MIVTGNDFDLQIESNPTIRLVSLVPSITELLYYFDLNGSIVGVTKFCELPEIKLPEPQMIGGTKNPSIERIISLKPDIIFASKEENNKVDIELLSENAIVVVTDIKNINDNIQFIDSLIRFFQPEKSKARLSGQLSELYQNRIPDKFHDALYLIWQSPFMSAGHDTFIHDMMRYAGFKNVMADKVRYPEIDVSMIKDIDPLYILLSSEPYPFKHKHVEALEAEYPSSKVLLVDGQMFSWYGVRPLYAAEYFDKLKGHFK